MQDDENGCRKITRKPGHKYPQSLDSSRRRADYYDLIQASPLLASVPTRKKRLLCLVNLVSFFVHGIYTTM